MTTEREPLCEIPWCPFPGDPFAHRCVVCQTPNNIDHEHVDPMGMGGSESRKFNKNNVIILCRLCHEKVTLRRWSKGAAVLPDGDTHQWILDERGKTLWERRITGSPELGAVAPVPPVREDSWASAYAFWVQHLKLLCGAERVRPWEWGDTLLGGEALGEEHAQAFEVDPESGYVAIDGVESGVRLPALNQWRRVAECYPAGTRILAPKVYWSHHRILMSLESAEERQAWLIRVRDEGLTIEQLKDALRAEGLLPERAKVRRYSVAELREKLSVCPGPWRQLHNAVYGTITARDFLDWLEAEV